MPTCLDAISLPRKSPESSRRLDAPANRGNERRAGVDSPIGVHLPTRPRFSEPTLRALREGSILGIRAGSRPHRIIGIWVVVVEGRAFVRSWSIQERSWYRTFLVEPRGVITAPGRKSLIPVRAVRTRSERLKDAVSREYRRKYATPGSVRYARDLGRPRSRDTTTELVPLA